MFDIKLETKKATPAINRYKPIGLRPDFFDDIN